MTPMRYMFYLLLGYRYYVALVVLAVVVWLVARRTGVLPVKSRRLAASAPKSNWASRAAESIVLLCVVLAFVPVMHMMRLPGYLQETPPGVVRVHTIFMVCLYVGAFVAAMICFLWRTSAGFVVGLCLCAVSFFYGAMWFNPLRILGIEDARRCEVPYTFHVYDSPTGYVSSGRLAGADIWVNDVYLGKSPLTITLNEFVEKVPHWAKPPVPNESVMRKRLRYDSHDSGWSGNEGHRRMKLVIPEMPNPEEFFYEPSKRKPGQSLREWGQTRRKAYEAIDKARAQRAKETESQRTYYARIQFGEAVGYGKGSGGGLSSGSGGGRRMYRGDARFLVQFPLREQRVDCLLDLARASDYEVGAEWFEAIESYGDHGWDCLYKAAYFHWLSTYRQRHESRGAEPVASEPGMVRVMDVWADRCFGISELKSERDAWDAFQRICRQADRDRRYSTHSIEGYALRRILPKLNSKQFVRWAVGRVKRPDLNHVAFRCHGRGDFEWEAPDRKEIQTRPSDYLALDAIFRMDKLLDEEDEEQYNIIEREVAKAMVVWHAPSDYLVYDLAASIDGPDLGPFFERFRIDSERWADRGPDWGFSTSVLDGVDRWLHLMASIGGQTGRELRGRYDREIMDMAAKIVENGGVGSWYLDFLAFDLDAGAESLAMRFWPRCKEIVPSKEWRGLYSPLYIMWTYLGQIERVATAEMFVQCWRETADKYDAIRDGLKAIDFLPAEKARAVLNAVAADVRQRPEDIRDPDSNEPSPYRAKWILERIDAKLAALTEQTFAEYMVGELRKGSAKWREHILEWLEEMRPGHVVAERLAESEDAALRKMAVRLLEAHPTARRREVLRGLLDDSDAEVREGAESAVEALKRLREMPPGELAAGAPIFGQ